MNDLEEIFIFRVRDLDLLLRTFSELVPQTVLEAVGVSTWKTFEDF